MDKPTAADFASAGVSWIRAENDYTEAVDDPGAAEPGQYEEYLQDLADTANERYLILEAMAQELADE